MNTFAISSSLLNSPLVKRQTTAEDIKYLTGEKTGRGASQRRSSPRRFNRKYQKSPDRASSWMRRRRLGSKSIAIPSELCEFFTEGERASLNIIANVIKEHGICEWPIDKIAAIAGVCRRTVQNALASAREAGLLSVQLRPVRGRKNLPNVIRIVNDRWLSWLKRIKSSFQLAIGCKTLHPTGEQIYKRTQNSDSSATLSSVEASVHGLMRGKKPDD